MQACRKDTMQRVFSAYTAAELRREARAAVRGRGRFVRWELLIGPSGNVQLRVWYRPRGQEAVAFTSVAL